MSRKIYLSSGHSNVQGRDQGAVGNGFIEGVETVKIKNRVAQILLQTYGIKAIVDKDNSILSETINYLRYLVDSKSILVDWHFNAATPQATGTETLVPSTASQFELDLAFALSHAAHVDFGIKKRGNFKGKVGVKSEAESHHGKLGWMRLSGENVLPEVCFISNSNDMTKYSENFESYCQNCALILYHFSNETQSQVLELIN